MINKPMVECSSNGTGTGSGPGPEGIWVIRLDELPPEPVEIELPGKPGIEGVVVPGVVVLVLVVLVGVLPDVEVEVWPLVGVLLELDPPPGLLRKKGVPMAELSEVAK
jgi:hypothetical protein